MIDVLQNIWGLIQQGWLYLVQTMESLVLALSFLTNSATFISSITLHFNPFISACVLATIAFAIIKFMLGR